MQGVLNQFGEIQFLIWCKNECQLNLGHLGFLVYFLVDDIKKIGTSWAKKIEDI